MKKQKRQYGDLLLGIIIGLVLGLGIAIVVALMVTKSTSKITSKYGNPGRTIERDASVPLPDPNKPLNSDVNSDKGTIKDGVKATAGFKSKTRTKAAAANAAQKKKEEKEPKLRKEWRYYLQAGAYLDKAEAENIQAQLAFMGLETYLSKKWSSRGTLHRVRMGPIADVNVMNHIRYRLIQSGFTPSVVRLEKKKN